MGIEQLDVIQNLLHTMIHHTRMILFVKLQELECRL